MTDKKKLANRIPFENLQEGSAVSAWSLPSMDVKSRKFYSAKRERQAKDSPATESESVEDYTSVAKPKPLTAQDLQKLAAEAKQEGFDSGYQEGLNKGLEDGTSRGEKNGEKKAYTETRKQLHDEISRLAMISGHLFTPMEKQAQDLENIIVDMSLRFAKEIIAHEISETPNYLVATVRNALMALPAGAANIIVYCNADDAAVVEKYAPADNRNWAIKIDPSISRGGCRIETLESLVDYTVDRRLEAFLQQVREKGEVDAADLDAPKDYAAEHRQANTAEPVDSLVETHSRPDADTSLNSLDIDDDVDNTQD